MNLFIYYRHYLSFPERFDLIYNEVSMYESVYLFKYIIFSIQFSLEAVMLWLSYFSV